MYDRLREFRRPVAVLTGLVLAATISVVAPATASAQEATKASTIAQHVQKAPAGKNAHDWTW